MLRVGRVDRGRIGVSSTSVTFVHITFDLGAPFYTLVCKMGSERSGVNRIVSPHSGKRAGESDFRTSHWLSRAGKRTTILTSRYDHLLDTDRQSRTIEALQKFHMGSK